ncbi:MAG: MFS transporter [Acidimicrobiaceae bacterium]|nr:MFS transporter [Acidimicrobiaceae bacterium]
MKHAAPSFRRPRPSPNGQSFEARRMISSLTGRNYRLFFTGQLISMAGTWMQTVAQSFLVLQLTGSGTDLGLATAARFLPLFLFGPFGGLIADRLDKRRVLYLTQTISGVLAFVFAVLVGTGTIEMWMVYLLALALGCVNVFDNPARQSFIAEMVPTNQLANAVTLNSVSLNMARVFGAAAGGALVAGLGLAMCFALNGVSFAAVLVSLLLMRGDQLYPSLRATRERGQVRAGLRYVWSTPELIVPMVMVAVIGTLAWEFQVTLPLVARDTFHRGAGAYGLMGSVMGVGAVVGGMVSASKIRPRARALGLAAIGWGVAIMAAALAPTLALELLALVFVGYGSITFNAMAKTTLQLASVPQMRGRVMALWALAWQGSTPIGGPIVGLVGQSIGARWSLVVGGLPTVLIGLMTWPALKRIDLRAALGRHETRVGPVTDEGTPKTFVAEPAQPIDTEPAQPIDTEPAQPIDAGLVQSIDGEPAKSGAGPGPAELVPPTPI